MGESYDRRLVVLDQAGRALAEARTVDQFKQIRDKAEAVRRYAQSASLGLAIQNRAAEVKLRAERQAGMLLAQMMLRGGDRKSKARDERLKLHDLGINRNQSTRWQKQARVPEKVFCEYVRQACEAGKEVTAAGLMRTARTYASQVPSRNGESYQRRRNGHAVVDHPPGNGASTPPPDIDEIVSELSNHYQVLDGLLRPYYSGETDNLTTTQRRVVRYYLAETGDLLRRLGTTRK